MSWNECLKLSEPTVNDKPATGSSSSFFHYQALKETILETRFKLQYYNNTVIHAFISVFIQPVIMTAWLASAIDGCLWLLYSI